MFSSLTTRKRRLLWFAIIGGVLTVASLILALVGIPLIIESIIAKYLVLEEDSEAWDRFEELPFPLDLNIYFFNVINQKDIIENGAKPQLVERGPYIYKNFRKKYDIVRLDDEYVSYYQNQLFEFDPDRTSKDLSLDDKFLSLNFLVIGLYQILENSRASIIDILPIDEILPFVTQDTNLFTELRVRNFLFEGTPFCVPERENTMAKMVCLVVLLLNRKVITYHDDLSMSFSMFAFKNNSHDGQYLVNTGQNDISKLGQVHRWNGMEYTKVWKGGKSHCNKIEGQDVTLFPPYFEEDKDFKVYSTDVCRSLTLSYQGKEQYKDIGVFKYGLSSKIFRPDDEESTETTCYSSDFTRGLDGEKNNFMDGTMDVYPCLGIPGLVSYPHFLYADQKYANGVEGLHADESKHASRMNLQPTTGVPMEGWISIQVNLIARPIQIGNQLMEVTKNLKNFSLPIIWLQQGVEINDEYYDLIHMAVTWLLVADIGKWVIVFISGVSCLIPLAMLILR